MYILDIHATYCTVPVSFVSNHYYSKRNVYCGGLPHAYAVTQNQLHHHKKGVTIWGTTQILDTKDLWSKCVPGVFPLLCKSSVRVERNRYFNFTYESNMYECKVRNTQGPAENIMCTCAKSGIYNSIYTFTARPVHFGKITSFSMRSNYTLLSKYG